MKVRELVEQLLELPQDDEIVITSMDDDFMCHEFSVHSPYEENTQAQELILPYYFNDYDEEPTCINNCEECTNYKCKCADCACLVEGDNGEWVCDTQSKPCAEITECGEW